MAHIHEKYDFVVSVFVVHKNKVLLVNHPRYDMWVPIGGHIELDENSDQALFREVFEESGLKIEIMSSKPPTASTTSEPLFTPNLMEWHEANPPHRHIALTYFAKTDDAKFKKSDEHTDMKWLSEKDLENPNLNLSLSVSYYAHAAIQLARTWPEIKNPKIH